MSIKELIVLAKQEKVSLLAKVTRLEEDMQFLESNVHDVPSAAQFRDLVRKLVNTNIPFVIEKSTVSGLDFVREVNNLTLAEANKRGLQRVAVHFGKYLKTSKFAEVSFALEAEGIQDGHPHPCLNDSVIEADKEQGVYLILVVFGK